MGESPLEINGNGYPGWATAIKWILVCIPFSIIIGCAIAQGYIFRNNWVKKRY